MKNKHLKLLALTVPAAFILFYSCKHSTKPDNIPIGPNGMPADAKKTFSFDSTDFARWFRDSSIATGFVHPPDGLAFPKDAVNFNFYCWAQQMFLWITSENTNYGADSSKTVLESPVFYTVAPGDSNNFMQKRVLYPHTPGHLPKAIARISQATNAPLQAESEQATNQLLMAQNGSLVYYLLFVNDVYAFYHYGAKTGVPGFSLEKFPSTVAERDAICALARKNGVTIPDSNALALELKTSWVDATNLPDDINNYITIVATVPVYKQIPGTKNWVMSGDTVKRLALIGMHVVGAVAGHPEMIWATFEHLKNAPNVAYRYVDSNNIVKTVPGDSTGRWLLNGNPADTSGCDTAHQSWSQTNGVDTITSDSNIFVPDKVVRLNPWGSVTDSATNPEDKSAAASNSEIISLNNLIYRLLPKGDVRKNYFLVGATWTFRGTAPSGQNYSGSFGDDPKKLQGVGIGTSAVANSTMETFLQTPSGSCFNNCHSGQVAYLRPDSISHIFTTILPQLPASMKKKQY